MPEIDLSEYYTQPTTTRPEIDLSSYISGFDAPIDQEEDEPSYLSELSGALSSGFRNMRAGTASTGFIVGAVEEETVAREFVDVIRNQPETPDYYRRYLELFEKEGKDVTEAEGVWDKTMATMDLLGRAMFESVVNPKAPLYMITESIANSAPALALGGAGAIGGGIAGGPPGVVAGLVGGTAAGTFAVEAGAHLNELIREKLAEDNRSFQSVTEEDVIEILQSESFLDWAKSESTKRGLTVAAVEGIFALFGGKLLSGAKGTVASGVARGAGDVAIETVGEMAGELAGQIVTEGPVDPGAVVMEGIAGAGQSVGTTLIGAAARRAFRGDALDVVNAETSETAQSLPGEDALDTVVRETSPVDEAMTIPTEEAPAVSELRTLVDQDRGLTQSALDAVEAGAIGDEVLDTLYQRAVELPESVRSDAQRELITQYDAQDPTIGERMRRGTRQEEIAEVTDFDFDDREAVLGLVDDALLGTEDRAFLAEQQVAEVEPTAEPAPMAETMAEIDRVAAEEAATSPLNDIPMPTEAQIEAGTYKKPKVKINDQTVAIENPKESFREGVSPTGEAWRQEMQDHYGYILGTRGKDKDHVDVFIGPTEDAENVFVVDQVNPDTGEFDEHKVIFGAGSERQAKTIYNRNYAEGWQGMGAVTQMTQEEFNSWVKDPARTQIEAAKFRDPISDQSRLRSVRNVGEVRSMTRATIGRRTTSTAAVEIQVPDTDQTLLVRVTQRPDENWTIQYSSVPSLTTPESLKAFSEFRRDFEKQFPQSKPAKKAKKAVSDAVVENSEGQSSKEVETEIGTTDAFIEAEMQSAADLAKIQFEQSPNLRNKGAFTRASANLRAQKAKMQAARSEHVYFEKGEESIDAVANKVVARSKADKTLRERVGDSVLGFLQDFSIREFFGTMVTDLYGIEKWEKSIFGERLSAEKSPTALSHAARNAKVSAAAAMNINGLKLDEFGTGLELNEDVKPLLKILDPVAKLGDKYRIRWEAWTIAQRSKRLIQEGREKQLTQEDIDTVLNWVEERPEIKKVFETALAEWQVFNRNTLETAVEAGSINREDAFGGYVRVDGKGKYAYKKDGSLYPSEESASRAAAPNDEVEFVQGWYQDDYVPFNRVAEEGVSGPKRSRKIGQQKRLVRELTGGEGQIPVIENMVRNTTAIISHTMNTIAMNQTVEMLKDVGVEALDDGGVPPLVDREVTKRVLDNLDVDFDSLTEPEIRRWERMLKAVNPIDEDVVVVYKNGKPKHYRILDRSLLRAVKHIGPAKVSKVLQVLGYPSRMLSFAVTKMPGFIVRNLVREIQNAYVINVEGRLNPFRTVAAAAKNMWRISKPGSTELNAMMARGMVSHNNYFDATPDDIVRNLKQQGKNRSMFRSTLGSIEAMYRAYNKLAVASEHATRIMMRDDFIAAGYTQAEAEYQGLDVLNHSRRGEGPIIEFMVAVTPFLNPRIQGIDRLYRGSRQHKAAYFMKAALLMAGATALAAWNWENNEEEMDELTEVEKDLYFHFWIEGEHFRIPKGFEVGQIAGTFPERVVEHIVTEEPEYISETIKRFLITTMAVDLPQFIRPVAEVAMDYDSFAERSILGFGDQFASPEEQYNTWTSELSKLIATAMPDNAPEKLRSPKMVDHILKGYTGPMGMWVLERIDQLYEMTGNAPDSPTKALGERDIIRNLYRGQLKTPSRHVQRFYDMMNESRRITADLKNAKDRSIDEWSQMVVKNADKRLARKELNRYDTQMRKLNKRYNTILSSGVLNGDIKATMLQEITVQRNRLAAEASQLYWWAFR